MDQGPKILCPGLSGLKHAEVEQRGTPGELLSACKIRRKGLVLILWIKFLYVACVVHPSCILNMCCHMYGILHYDMF